LGLTANSVTMLGADPPQLLWSLGKHSRSRRAFEECEYFTVNVLGEDQASLAMQMAGPGDRYAGVEWQPAGSAGLPLFAGAVAWFECRCADVFDVGDHLSLIGDIIHHQRGTAAPLLYAGGQFLRLTRSRGARVAA
jgi:flavin reductase (DIM6/NTAB) family NADH-FMN oxidoreductase RutF